MSPTSETCRFFASGCSWRARSASRSLRICGARPYRAELVERDSGRWVLLSIKTLCASCFGTGIVEANQRPCDTRDGSGWGLQYANVLRIPA